MAQNTPTLPQQIEIFRAGTHTADNGTSHTFTPADVAGMVSAYDPAVHEAPLCVGHPQDNKPAYGWVKSLAVAPSGALAMDTHNIAPAFAEAVNSKAFKKRSASFYPPNHPQNPKQGSWYLRHVAFLGAQPPAIKGLADFTEADSSAVEDGYINFSEPIFNPPTKDDKTMDEVEKLKQQLAAAEAEKAKLEAEKSALAADKSAADTALVQFKEAKRKEKLAEFTQFCEKSNIKPTEKAAAVAVLAMLADMEAPVSFSEGNATKTVSPVEFVKGLIGALPDPVQFGEQMGGSGGNAGGIDGLTEKQLEQKIQDYKEKHNVGYDKAFAAVCSFTQGA
jgi:hypothetical protein